MSSVEVYQQTTVPTRSPKKKHVRDSLNRRFDTGNPGSKRYQRWFNGHFLEEQASSFGIDLEHQIFENRSPFRELFEGNYLGAFEQYFQVSEEREREIMMSLENQSMKEKRTYKMVPPSQCFRKLEKQCRKMIEKHEDHALLATVDKQMIEFIQHTTARKTIHFEDAYHRLLCHSIASFYSLESQSQDTRNGQRVIFISKPDFMLLPSCTLSEYLLQRQ